jgi:hypothetical protein
LRQGLGCNSAASEQSQRSGRKKRLFEVHGSNRG